MENMQETQQLRQYLAEAVDMLDDLKPKLALFEKQRYFRFKAQLRHFCEQDAMAAKGSAMPVAGR
ncbi:hypothetical protein [Mucilaginibacter pedocola]|uniref:Uncharacterized protein n=1 Tax=Mucilaginibacter pedocola TaxID=1792845 RepID=A0A1S9PMQ3_9SPHI|nr:hypothetical protein [Mucilaginibacter pedocola]OOQ62220.1 hypothetical protein BC343_04035 [Mucilaginibacter pedocola]